MPAAFTISISTRFGATSRSATTTPGAAWVFSGLLGATTVSEGLTGGTRMSSVLTDPASGLAADWFGTTVLTPAPATACPTLCREGEESGDWSAGPANADAASRAARTKFRYTVILTLGK